MNTYTGLHVALPGQKGNEKINIDSMLTKVKLRHRKVQKANNVFQHRFPESKPSRLAFGKLQCCSRFKFQYNRHFYLTIFKEV